jgi:hypothetical protein
MAPRALAVAVTLLLAVPASGCVVKRRRSDDGGSTANDPPPPPPQPPPGSPPPQQQPAPQQPAPKQEPKRDDVYELDARWRPLERIQERIALPGMSSTATTISPVVYVEDLPGFLRRNPPGTPTFEALLLHEQLHAKRQVAAGVDPWVQRYLQDTAFMWAEEQRGWYLQMQSLQRAGLRLDVKAIARSLATYRNLAGYMVSEAEAEKWATQVVQGQWRPKD